MRQGDAGGYHAAQHGLDQDLIQRRGFPVRCDDRFDRGRQVFLVYIEPGQVGAGIGSLGAVFAAAARSHDPRPVAGRGGAGEAGGSVGSPFRHREERQFGDFRGAKALTQESKSPGLGGEGKRRLHHRFRRADHARVR
jgi:hypothetical protein